MENNLTSKWLLLGASTGLGKSFAELLLQLQLQSLSYSRRSGGFDASRAETWGSWLENWSVENPTRLVCFVGGGPFGPYETKDFKDHQWAFRINFEFQAFLLHQILAGKALSTVRQICLVGSAIAEARPDPLAASYAAAKHALLGLVTSVQNEGNKRLDVRLFSPGYLDTGLLPKNAWPRQRPGLVKTTQDTSQKMLIWLQDPACANQHQVFE